MGMAAFAAPVAAAAAAEEEPPYEAWWEKTENVMKFTAWSPDRSLTLKVELTIPPEKEITETQNDAGEMTGYQWKNHRMPTNFTPGSTYLTKFLFEWEGKEIPIPEKLWNDMACMTIQDCKVNPKDVPEKFAWKFHKFLSDLQQPRVVRSVDGGTALIEWYRPEECDSHSMIRWMVGRSGTVLRHRAGTDGC